MRRGSVSSSEREQLWGNRRVSGSCAKQPDGAIGAARTALDGWTMRSGVTIPAESLAAVALWSWPQCAGARPSRMLDEGVWWQLGVLATAAWCVSQNAEQ